MTFRWMLRLVALASVSVTAFPSSAVEPVDGAADRGQEFDACAPFLTADGSCEEPPPTMTRAPDEDEQAFLERSRVHRRERDRDRRLREIACRFQGTFGWTPNVPRTANGPRQLPDNFQVIWSPEDPSEIIREREAASKRRTAAANAGPVPQTTGKPAPGEQNDLLPEEQEEEEQEQEEKEEEEEDDDDAEGGMDESGRPTA